MESTIGVHHMIATLELLHYLKKEDFVGLVRRHGEFYFHPVKGDLEEIINSLNTTPLCEDTFISIEMAIAYFDIQPEELELAEDWMDML